MLSLFTYPFQAAKPVVVHGHTYSAFEGSEITMDGILITGEEFYDLPFILKNLGFPRTQAADGAGHYYDLNSLKGKRVVTVAEGHSPFLPFLHKEGVKIEGVEPWYSPEVLARLPRNYGAGQMRRYYDANRASLVEGDALHLPYADGSVDVLLNHMMVTGGPHGMSTENAEKFLDEAVRVLSKGGEARIAGFRSGDLPAITAYLHAKYGDRIRFERHQFITEPHLNWYAGMIDYSGLRTLIITKVR